MGHGRACQRPLQHVPGNRDGFTLVRVGMASSRAAASWRRLSVPYMLGFTSTARERPSVAMQVETGGSRQINRRNLRQQFHRLLPCQRGHSP
jgi:hypothetical protein